MNSIDLAKLSHFRAAAVRNYLSGRTETVLPRFLRDRLLLPLWICVFGCTLAALLAWWRPFPVTIDGVGHSRAAQGAHRSGRPRLQIVVPSGDEMRTGQRFSCTWGENRDSLVLEGTIISISPAAPTSRRSTSQPLDDPEKQPMRAQSTLAEAVLDSPPPDAVRTGRPCKVRVTVGSRRLASLINKTLGGAR
jgi:hypothetical protein